MRFECGQYNPNDKRSSSGSVAIWWTEAQAGTEWFVMMLGEWTYYASMFFLFVGIIITGVYKIPPIMPAIGVVLFGVAYGLSWCAWRISGDVREVRFERDGTLSAPYGLSTWGWRYRRMNAPHSEINGFEWEQLYQPKQDEFAPYTHGVVAILKDGSVCRLAKNLEPENARQLVVKLTHGLAEQRVKEGIAAGGPIYASID